jgi:hypothetical protein
MDADCRIVRGDDGRLTIQGPEQNAVIFLGTVLEGQAWNQPNTSTRSARTYPFNGERVVLIRIRSQGDSPALAPETIPGISPD